MDEPRAEATDLQPGLEGRAGASRHLVRRILSLALPALGALIAEPLFTLIDSAMVGHLGTPQLAALSLASQVLQTLVVLFIFLAYSTTSLTARALGASDKKKALQVGVDASWLALGLGLGGAVLLAWAAPALVDRMTPDPRVAAHAIAYLRASAPGIVGMLIGFSTVGTLRGLQDTKTPLLVTSLGAVLNVGLNALLMYGIGMGVAGSGLGTSIVQLAMAGVYLAILRAQARKAGVALAPSGAGILGATKEGAPLVLRGLALRAAGLATIWPVSRIGSEALASYQVVLATWTLSSFILDALAIAAQSLVGLAIGRGDRSALKELLRILTRCGIGAGLLLGVLIAAASPWTPLLFGSDPAVRPIATIGLLVSCASMPISAVVFMLDGVLLGAGDNIFFAKVALVQLAILMPALAAVEFAREGGAGPAFIVGGVWAAYGLVYMGARFVFNMHRTWRSPKGPLGIST